MGSDLLFVRSILIFICIAAQLTGLISVIINRSRLITGIFTIVTGIATALSGTMAFSSLGAPDPQDLGMISLISIRASFLFFIYWLYWSWRNVF